MLILAAAAPSIALEPATDQDNTSGPPIEVTVTDRGTVRMHVADLPLSTVLHLLSLESQRNIVASPKVKGSVTANLYDVTFEEALGAILVANDAVYRMEGKFVYIFTRSELAELDKAQAPPPVTRVYRLNYVSAKDAQSYLAAVIGEGDTVAISPPAASGIKTDADKAGGNESAAQPFVIVTAGPDVQRRVASVLKSIDVRPRQVLIEATILRAQLSDDHSLGIDFSLVGGVDLELLGATSTGIANISLGGLPTDRLERFNAAASTDFNRNLPGGGLSIGIIKDHVAVFVKAIEEITDTTVLANPKLLALNRQKAQVIVGRRDGYFTTTVTQTQAIQTVEFLETGTQLVFRPFIGDDGFIRVELHPEDSVGFVNAQGLPSEQTTEVTTNVIIRDGETILIGGLFREVTTDARSQVPALGSLPVIGMLFRSKSESTDREEVIILLTIHIIKDRDAYATASRNEFDNIERMRVGLRHGLMWSGRDRLAQAHYRKALDAVAIDDPDKALWHTNMALHNLPVFMPGIRLKEKILGERAWDEDCTGGRTFLRSLIMKERGYSLPPFGRPDPRIAPAMTPQSSPSGEDENDGS